MEIDVIADSENKWGDRMTTFLVQGTHMLSIPSNYYIHATRLISPFEVTLREVKEDPEFVDEDNLYRMFHHKLVKAWDKGEVMEDQFLQYSAPFQKYRYILTSTYWEHLFEVLDLAPFKREWSRSNPTILSPGEYHTPFYPKSYDEDKLLEMYEKAYEREPKGIDLEQFRMNLSFIRCVYHLRWEPISKTISRLSSAHSRKHHFKKDHIAMVMTRRQRDTFRKIEPSVIMNSDLKGWNKRYRGFIDMTSMFRKK